jgi:hypothetical protein
MIVVYMVPICAAVPSTISVENDVSSVTVELAETSASGKAPTALEMNPSTVITIPIVKRIFIALRFPLRPWYRLHPVGWQGCQSAVGEGWMHLTT